MCSQYTVKLTAQDLETYGIYGGPNFSELENRILPQKSAPVIVLDKSKRKLTPMRFSLVPSWAAEPRVKFATHNARVETVLVKPTWRTPFRRQHCVVPMTGFFESAYAGPEAGHIIQFKNSKPDMLFAAGIFDFWRDSIEEKNSFFSFAILTRAPSTFIEQHGHDRTPIFIHFNDLNSWLATAQETDESLRSQLCEMAYHPELIVEIDRAMKPGWENR